MNLFAAPELFTGINPGDVLMRGILILLLGILLAILPFSSLLFITMVIGWFFAIAAVWVILGGVVNKERRLFWTVYGLVMGIFAILMITHPFGVDFLLAWFFALWFVTGGVIAIWDAAQSKMDAGQKIFPVVSGLIAMFIGYAFFVLPLTSLAGMIWLIGLLLILKGIMMIAFSRILKKRKQENPVSDQV